MTPLTMEPVREPQPDLHTPAAARVPSFALLPKARRRTRAFSLSLLGQIVFLLLLIIIGERLARQVHLLQAQQKYIIYTPAKPLPQPKPIQVPPPRELAKILPPPVLPPPAHTLTPPAPVPQPKRPQPQIQQPQPRPQPKPLPVPKPQVHTGLFASVKPAQQINRPQAAVHSGLFPGSKAQATLHAPRAQVQTGGFGSEGGVPAHTSPHGRGAKLGMFGAPEGPGHGNGTAGAHGLRGTIASAGFGSGIAGSGSGTQGHGGGGVHTGGFGSTIASGASSPAARAPSGPQHHPVVVLAKPKPAYTAEARQLRIQGSVLLNVIFKANGQVQVLGVLRGLGHGLDQSAEQAARAIRFRPARDGNTPVDEHAHIEIVFQLAD